jgi:UDP-galactopyranose mutase
MFDYLIVGAGYAGSVIAERLASQAGKRVLLCDRRPHIAGNAYDHYNDGGILVHKYGPHIFHTNSAEIFQYLSQFTEWRPYEHRVVAYRDGKYYPMPINRTTVNLVYGLDLQTEEACEEFFKKIRVPIERARNSAEVAVGSIGEELYEKFIRGYTRRHWGLDPSELDASVVSRIPSRCNTDDRYFTDKYQFMPLHGYTRMFENMLSQPNIKILLNTDYREILGLIPFREMIYTGPVDEYFGFRYGKLPYLSLEFKHETHDQEWFLPAPVVNSADEGVPYDRVTEFKYLTGQVHPKTGIVYEYPIHNANGDPYYPVPRPENAEIYRAYKELADDTPGVYFVGRLATYKYYNMDQVTAQALAMFKRIVTGQTATVAGATAEAAPAKPRLVVRPTLPGEEVARAAGPSVLAAAGDGDGRVAS